MKVGSENLLAILFRFRRILATTTRNELDRRYSGTLFGSIWIVLYPLLFLSVYLFVYLVIFKTRWPGFSELDYVLYVFSGLVPYIAFMETFQNGAQSIKQNLHLIKNVMLPVELIPARAVFVALVAHIIGLILVLLLAGANHSLLSGNLYLLPLSFLILTVFLLGLAYIMAPLGIILPDVNHVTGIISLFLVFVSPVGFKPDMIPDGMRLMVDLNPIFYIMAPYRMTFGLFGGQGVDWQVIGISAGLALTIFVVGSRFFRKFKNFLVDYE